MSINNLLQTELKYLKGVGPIRSELLANELQFKTFFDLLYYFPYRYIDRTQIHLINTIQDVNVSIQLQGTVVSTETVGKGRAMRFVAKLQDSTGQIDLVWFQGIKWIKDKIQMNQTYLVYGKPTRYGRTFNITHPEIEKVEPEITKVARFQAVYSSTEKLNQAGLNSKGFNQLMSHLIPMVFELIPENLSSIIIRKHHFISHSDAIRQIHFPQSAQQVIEAQNRLKYEDFFFIQMQLLGQKVNRHQRIKGIVFDRVGEIFNQFYQKYLPFSLTNAQKRVIKEIRSDFASSHQMNRLLQGDVGSGKTMVALLCMLIALDNKFQTALMAPTEILAYQHFQTISKLLSEMSVEVRLLTGSTPNAQRKEYLEDLASGRIDILIGTHALIEPTVVFNNLGFVVIDEQHRFGVEQRAKLWKKGKYIPHILVMTATPIPRTMAMTLYGDLDYSVIDELPLGRKDIQTFLYSDSKRIALFGFIRRQIAEGRQVYVVFPLINESETLDLKDLQDGYDGISREFPRPQYFISIVHGQMKAKDKEIEMARFKRGETHILIATTVIEVGVDVPNATVMVIENAERFGLSQLHQLRGRVGRGGNQSYCILMAGNKLSAEAKARLEIMVQTNDGFKIAEADLKLRGPGDIQGTQQSGILALSIADLVKDEAWLKLARKDAEDILSADPNLQNPINAPISQHIISRYKGKSNWSIVS